MPNVTGTAGNTRDIICVSEARAKDDDIVLTGGHRLVTSLMDDPYAGVGILIHARWSANVLYIRRNSNRIIYIC